VADARPPADAAAAAGQITGTIRGQAAQFPVVVAYWIGKPAPGTPPNSEESPVSLFLLEAPLTCAEISRLLWDKAAPTQILEINLSELAASTYPIGRQAIANYRARPPNAFNPDSASGSVTITGGGGGAAGQNVAGAFDIVFAGNQPTALKGSFNAAHCPTGVEP
jgi:hypothetical protein